MGQTQNKQAKEEIIIAQNGGNGNSASATETTAFNRDVILVGILVVILIVLVYAMWKRCKVSYGRYLREQLHRDRSVRRPELGLESNAHQPRQQHVIV